MAVDLSVPQFTFAIDTNEYAGNFERETTAFVVGVYGDCGKGSEIAEAVQEKIPEELREKVAQVADEHGCCRPTSMGRSPDSKKYNTVEIYFHERPTDEELKLMAARAHEFAETCQQYDKFLDPYKVLGIRLVEREIVVKDTELWRA